MARIKTVMTVAMATVMGWPAMAFAGDPATGERVFRTCVACHSVEEDRNKVGPHLIDVFGRVPGTVPGFRYSRAMIEFGEAGNVWNAETIGAYLTDPRGYIRGNRMAFAGLRSEEQVADVLAYIAQFSESEAEAQ